MKIFLNSDYLFIEEEELFEGVLNWATCQTKNKMKIDKYAAFDGEEPSRKKQKSNDFMNEEEDEKFQEIKFQFLKSVAPFIRFGLMDGKYLSKTVRPLNILSDKDIADILCYQHCPDLECGRFPIKQRIRPTRQIKKIRKRGKKRKKRPPINCSIVPNACLFHP